MAQRVTRSLNENKLYGAATKNANIGVVGGKKRKALEDPAKENVAKSRAKRAAFGDLTNAKGSEKSISQWGTVKKGLSQIVGKNKNAANNAIQLAEKKQALKAVVAEEETISEEACKVVTTESAPSLSVSTSSEEALVCNISEEASTSSDSVEVSKVSAPSSPVVRSPVRVLPPPGVVDFDSETLGDPQQHAEYALETFHYYRQREATFRVPSYMGAQQEVTQIMRAILVDWLVEVQESFELNHETLYTAVKMTDLYLSKKQVRKEDLQLVGATACLISCKVDERTPPMVDDFLYVCDDAYSRDQLMKMERKMLMVVGFDVGYPLTYRFLRRYGRVCKLTMPVLTLARYILELSLMEYNFNVECSESEVAAGCLILALKMKGIKGWGPTLSYYSGYKLADLQSMVDRLLGLLKQPAKDNLKTVRAKYGHKVFHEVASTPVPESAVINGLEDDLPSDQ